MAEGAAERPVLDLGYGRRCSDKRGPPLGREGCAGPEMYGSAPWLARGLGERAPIGTIGVWVGRGRPTHAPSMEFHEERRGLESALSGTLNVRAEHASPERGLGLGRSRRRGGPSLPGPDRPGTYWVPCARGTRRREAPEGTMGGREPLQMTSGAGNRARLGGTANVPRQRRDGPLPSPTGRWQRGTYVQGPARIVREGCAGLRIEAVVEVGGSGRRDPERTKPAGGSP